ncbi:MAG: UvrD-helicase domain-containing protein [Calditrichaeota bacterium]|nr:UvrD-helicase domain-containing protein [Calditrichota bacterium]
MQGIEKKIIRASAGTGKTYRLSLEYIGLLLKYQSAGLDFSEILVITFTRKATAEIRQRIFDHLAEIVSDANGKRNELEENLKAVTGISVSDKEREALQQIYRRMIANKNQVQISTIDSFTNQIFKTVIGPYLGIMDYNIVSQNDDAVLAEIYQTMLTPENLELLEKFYFRTGKRQISNFKNLVNSLIDRRWIFDLMDESQKEEEPAFSVDDYYRKFRENFDEVLDRLQAYIDSDEKKSRQSAKDLLNKSFYEKFFQAAAEVSGTEITEKIKSKLEDKKFLLENYSAILSDPHKINFWNGSRIYRKKADAPEKETQFSQLGQALRYFADWVFAQLGAREANEIREIARRILARYDEIKFREKKFTYNDISYYTFKYLYDPSLSLIEDGAVSNQFFEYLTGKIRFILIDEFQDTSVIQYKILYPMIREVISGSGVKDYGGVIVVGDEKQSIYGWRGGERDLLLNLDKALHGAESSKLTKSYRSERQIIAFVNMLFGDENLHAQLRRFGIDWQYEQISDNKNETRGFVSARFANVSRSDNGSDATTLKMQAQRKFLLETIYPLIEAGDLSLSGTAILARKNQDLIFAAAVLNELGVPYMSESSLSVVRHSAIKPLFYFYRFCVFRDFYDLLSFLRSDYALMPAGELREFIDIFRSMAKLNLARCLELAKHLPTIGFFQKLLTDIGYLKEGKFINSGDAGNGILALTKKLLEHYSVIRIFSQENDLKNIHLFLEIIALFENDRQSYTQDLRGFLQFCEDLESDDSFKQAGLETVDAIRLLTIHKAKGLEFDNVILLWNLSGRGSNTHGTIQFYPQYNSGYKSLEKFSLTYNFDKVLPFSSQKELFEAAQIRQAIEVMNLFYVAMTRAKANLFLFFTFQNKDGLEKFFDKLDSTENPRIDGLLAKYLHEILPEKSAGRENESTDCSGEIGELYDEKKSAERKTTPEKDFSWVTKYLTFEQFANLVPVTDETTRMSRADLIRRFVHDRSAVKGDVAHYYLSFIKFDSPEARSFARKRALMKYGSLLPAREIEHILQRTNEFIDKNKFYFSRENWDLVFTEWTISPPTEGQLRLDRMMVNQVKKQMMILDYKTGEVWHEEQIEVYKKAVEELPAVKNQGYRVETKYVKIDLA